MMKMIYALLAVCISGSSLGEAVQPVISEGHYLALMADCDACHSQPGQPRFTGGVKIDTPVGAIYSTNITPDRDSGMGNYSFSEFSRVMRDGVAKDGHYLYPAMPYTAFHQMNDVELRALYNYIMQEVPPVRARNRSSDIRWPLNMRWPLWLWDRLFLHDEPFRPDPQQSAQWNRGAWLVQGPGHCGSCHTPRGIGYQEKAQDQRAPAWLSGATVAGWYAPNLTGNATDGLGRWQPQDIVTFLRSGRTERSMAFGPMREVVEQSTRYMRESDLAAMATYLKSLPAAAERKTTVPDVTPADFSTVGGALYQDNCAACHRSNGEGYRHTSPALAGNSALLGDDPSSLIAMILYGGKAPVTAEAVTGMAMPGFGWRLSDGGVAELSTFIRSSWGNHADSVTAEQVKALRH